MSSRPSVISPAGEGTANEMRESEWKSHHRGRSHAFPTSRLSSHAAIFTRVRVFHSLKFICLFIHISTRKQSLNIICSQVAELIKAAKVHIHKEEKKKQSSRSLSEEI